MSGTAKSRLIYELIMECRRFGTQDKPHIYALNVNEVDFAARSGLSRETISREMQKLKDLGIVSINGKVIEVKDLLALEKMLGGEI
jgi:CRP-like cAMP-binding protein